MRKLACVAIVLAACSGEAPECGDEACEGGESCETCPGDCGDCCGGCGENASCVEGSGGWACECGEGYEGDGIECTDVDECAAGTDECSPLAECTNTDGGYACACIEGYEGDGWTCTDVDECEEGTDSCAPNATCVNTDGGHECDCASWSGANCYFSIRAVCVIVDFADRRLEDYASTDPDAFTSEGIIRARLDEMSAHWSWMSLGTREMIWDIVRIELEQTLAPESFAGWPEFRRAVSAALAEAVDPALYDVDSDGVVDAAWYVASSGEIEYDYLTGGMSRSGSVNVFVDGQGSLSVRSAAVGNFNHEVGHCLGLPDIYGDHDTLLHLSLMSDSWPVPPYGFSAFDRLLLGWTDPVVVEAAASVSLGAAEQGLEAVLVPADRPSEYFLIENRVKPSSGFGSASGTAFDGLAIYHVLASRISAGADNVLPPLIRLEPADGSIADGSHPEPGDFWYPGNPAMTGPFVGTSWFTSEPAVRIEGLARSGDRIEFDVTRLASSVDLPDLVANGNFESGTSAPDSWDLEDWTAGATFTWEHGTGRGGSSCVRIDLSSINDASWFQAIPGLVPGGTYELRGWIRGEGIEGLDAGTGASLAVMDSYDRSPYPGLGSFDWTEVSVAFTAPSSTPMIQCRLGHAWSAVSGTAWFDDLTLVMLAD